MLTLQESAEGSKPFQRYRRSCAQRRANETRASQTSRTIQSRSSSKVLQTWLGPQSAVHLLTTGCVPDMDQSQLCSSALLADATDAPSWIFQPHVGNCEKARGANLKHGQNYDESMFYKRRPESCDWDHKFTSIQAASCWTLDRMQVKTRDGFRIFQRRQLKLSGLLVSRIPKSVFFLVFSHMKTPSDPGFMLWGKNVHKELISVRYLWNVPSVALYLQLKHGVETLVLSS